MATVPRLTGYIYDSLLELEDGAAALTASGAGSSVVDLGASVHMTGDIVLDISGIDTTTGDELYDVLVEVSDDPAVATGVELAGQIQLGGVTGASGSRDVASDVGRYIIPFNNQLNDRAYRYVNIQFVISGTTPILTVVAYLSKHKDSEK